MILREFKSFRSNEMGGAEIMLAMNRGTRRKKNTMLKVLILVMITLANAVLWYNALLINQ